jgi:hypothetical protein
MDPLRCRSHHGWETQCGGCGAKFGRDVVVELDEEDEWTASGER